MTKETSIINYINHFDQIKRAKLLEIYELISREFPFLKEKIAWQMPSFYDQKIVISFAAHDKHLGVYPGLEVIEAFHQDLKPYKTTKGSIHFSFDQPLDQNLIINIVNYNLGLQGKTDEH
ncbi:MAG: DUF1801 domain-containing protein [Acholeplasmataceae bacterium]